MFSASEKKIVKKIREWVHGLTGIYYFWFVYDTNGNAINWEGGTGLTPKSPFRNDYYLEIGNYKRVKKTNISK